MRFILVVLLLLLVQAANSQMVYKPEVYKKVVHDFYDHVLNKKFTSLKDYNDFFGQSAEDEIVLFFKKCDNGKQTEECSKIAREQLASWSSHESLVFLELKKNKQLMTQGEDDNLDIILSKMKIVDNYVPSAIDVELKFSNGSKIIFVINNVEKEPPYIIDIFLPSGLSVFNQIGTRTEKLFYKRLAKINDPDGYTNVREGKGTNYPVKLKLEEKDIFFVYPNYKESWWMIEKLNCEKGYVSKNRIKLIGNLAEKEKASLVDTVTYIYSRPPYCN